MTELVTSLPVKISAVRTQTGEASAGPGNGQEGGSSFASMISAASQEVTASEADIESGQATTSTDSVPVKDEFSGEYGDEQLQHISDVQIDSQKEVGLVNTIPVGDIGLDSSKAAGFNVVAHGEELPSDGKALPVAAIGDRFVDAVHEGQKTKVPDEGAVIVSSRLAAIPAVGAGIKDQTILAQGERAGQPALNLDPDVVTTAEPVLQQQGTAEGTKKWQTFIEGNAFQREVADQKLKVTGTSIESLPDSEVGTRLSSTVDSAIPQSRDTSLLTLSSDVRAGSFVRIETPITQSGWGEEVSSRVQWLVRNNISSAELRLNPAELGPIEVRIKSEGDQASVLFVAQQSATRDALEQALPRLREMLESSGIQLADADVAGHDQLKQQQQETGALSSGSQPSSRAEVSAETSFTQSSVASTSGLIDFYI